jgi:regulator of replication initiation timing
MDTKGITDRIINLKARLFELSKETEMVRDELMLSIGKSQAFAEVEAKIKKELEAQKPKGE